MPGTITHALSMTTPDDPLYENKPSNWNATHAVTFNLTGSEISGAFSNANGISFGLSADAVTASHNGLTSQSNQNVTANNGGFAFQTLSFSNANGISFGTSAGSAITGSHNALTTAALSDHSHGNPTLALTNISGTTASASNGFTLSLSGNAAGGGDAIRGIAANGSTASTNTVNFSNANGVSFGFGAAGNSTVLTASHNARASTDAIGLNTAKTNVTWTVNSSGLSIDAGGYAGTASSFGGTNISGSMTNNTAGLTLSLSVAAPGGGAATYSNYYEYFVFDQNTATSSLGLGTLGIQPFSLPVNLSFGQLNMIGSAGVGTVSASNNWSVRLTNSTQALFVTSGVSITNSHFLDLYLFTRGTGIFSTELETMASTRNSFITYMNVTYSASATLTNASSGSLKISQSQSMSVSYPMITSSTATSINAASTYTAWGTGYTTWTSSASNTTSSSMVSSAAVALSIASTFPGTTAWSSYKMVPLNWANSLTPGEYYLGVVRRSSTSSSGTSNSSITGAAGTGASFSVTYAGSNLTTSGQLTYAGNTQTIVSSLGWLGFASQATMAADPGIGTFSATWTDTATYLNNMGNPNGAIAYSQINTAVSFFRTWFQFASNRI